MPKHLAVNQPSWAPTRKVLAGWLAGGGAVAVTGLLVSISDSLGQGTFWGALATATISGAVSYLRKAYVAEVRP